MIVELRSAGRVGETTVRCAESFDCSPQAGGRYRLEEIVQRVHFERADGVLIERRDEHHRHRRIDDRQQLEPRLAGELNVEKHDIRVAGAHELGRRANALRLTDHAHRRGMRLLEHRAELATCEAFVVDDDGVPHGRVETLGGGRFPNPRRQLDQRPHPPLLVGQLEAVAAGEHAREPLTYVPHADASATRVRRRVHEPELGSAIRAGWRTRHERSGVPHFDAQRVAQEPRVESDPKRPVGVSRAVLDRVLQQWVNQERRDRAQLLWAPSLKSPMKPLFALQPEGI